MIKRPIDRRFLLAVIAMGVLLVTLLSAATSASAGPQALLQATAPNRGPTTYTVKAGDTLGSIALAFQVTVKSLLAANPAITNPSRIFVGQVLNIPAPNLQPGQSVWAGFVSPTPGGTAIPSTGGASATATPHSTATFGPGGYQFASPTNACGWGSRDGQVVGEVLYVSPGFNLALWLRFHPGVTFAQLQHLNPGLVDGVQRACRAIKMPNQ